MSLNAETAHPRFAREPSIPTEVGAEGAVLSAGATLAEVRILFTSSPKNCADALSPLTAALIRALLVPGVGLCHTEDSAEVALALEATQSGFERLVAANLDLDRHAVSWILREGVRLGSVRSFAQFSNMSGKE